MQNVMFIVLDATATTYTFYINSKERKTKETRKQIESIKKEKKREEKKMPCLPAGNVAKTVQNKPSQRNNTTTYET